jgi:hypothetical protein
VVGLNGTVAIPVLHCDYRDERAIEALLDSHYIHTVISALNADFDDVAEAQVRLVNASHASQSVRRFIPSEFNIDYALPDSILHYPQKRYHMMARATLERTDLEFTYVYIGMFMDYFGLPKYRTALRELYILFDLENEEAILPGDGGAKMATTRAVDAARLTVAVLKREQWPQQLKIVGTEMTLIEMVQVAKKYRENLSVQYNDIDRLKRHRGAQLTGNARIDLPGMSKEDMNILSDELAAAIALGAYDLTRNSKAVDLVGLLDYGERKPMTFGEFMHEVWST